MTFCSWLLSLKIVLSRFNHYVLSLEYEFHCMDVCVCSVVQLCLTLCDPMNGNPPDSSVHGIFPARILEWVAIFSSRDAYPAGISHLLHCRQILYCWATWEAQLIVITHIYWAPPLCRHSSQYFVSINLFYLTYLKVVNNIILLSHMGKPSLGE